MKSSFRIASLTFLAVSTLLLGACASTTEAGVSADASGTEVNASTSTTTTTTTTSETPASETTPEEQSDGSGTP